MHNTILQVDKFSDILLLVVGVFTIIIFLTLFFITAPYGRFVNTLQHKKKYHVLLSKRTGWLIMEMPAVLAIFIMWGNKRCWLGGVFLSRNRLGYSIALFYICVYLGIPLYI